MKSKTDGLGDFTATPRIIPISLLAIVIGLLSTFVAWALLHLIAFFTNVFYYGRFSAAPASPAGHHLGWFAVLIPVAGGLIIGFMALYGSERIRGHGIPEALESILINGSKVQPRLAILKPISAAISIGSGGPFGAEGPIIMTGGALGSVIAQLFHLTAAERKTLLVAGAAAGMAAPLPRRSQRCCWQWNCCCSNGSRAARFRWRWPVLPLAHPGATFSVWVRFSRCRSTPFSSVRRVLRGACLPACWLARYRLFSRSAFMRPKIRS